MSLDTIVFVLMAYIIIGTSRKKYFGEPYATIFWPVYMIISFIGMGDRFLRRMQFSFYTQIVCTCLVIYGCSAITERITESLILRVLISFPLTFIGCIACLPLICLLVGIEEMIEGIFSKTDKDDK